MMTNIRHSKRLCYTQAFVLEFFYLALYVWTTVFALHLYQIIIKRCERPQKYLTFYSCVGWGIPMLFTLIVALRQLSGKIGVGVDDRPWCWLSNHSREGTWSSIGAWQQFGYFYLPISVILIFNVCLYVVIVVQMPSQESLTARVKHRLILYFAVFLFCAVWGFLNRMLQMLSPNHASNRFLDIMESAFDPLQPFLNAMVYATNRPMVSMYKQSRCMAWCWSDNDQVRDSGRETLLSESSGDSDDQDENDVDTYSGVIRSQDTTTYRSPTTTMVMMNDDE